MLYIKTLKQYSELKQPQFYGLNLRTKLVDIKTFKIVDECSTMKISINSRTYIKIELMSGSLAFSKNLHVGEKHADSGMG